MHVRNRFLHWLTDSSTTFCDMLARCVIETLLCRVICVAANEVSKSEDTRKVQYAYHFWKHTDAAYPNLSILVRASVMFVYRIESRKRILKLFHILMPPSRPRRQWIHDIEKWTGCEYIKLKEMSQDRAQWRRNISEWSSAVANPHRGRSTSEWVSDAPTILSFPYNHYFI